MKAPDDISEFNPSDDQSDNAHYNEDSNHGGDFSLSTTGLDEAADGFLISGEEGIDDDLATKKTTGSLSELLVNRNVYLLRHGKSGKATKDEDRKLAPLAEHQCSAFLSTYGSDLDRVNYSFASPTERTKETSSFLGFPDPVTVPYLYFQNYYTDEMQQLDDELGYAPLSDYFNAKEGGGTDLYAPVQAELGHQLAAALGKELEKAKAIGEWEGDLLIVTHATTISLVALEVLKAIKESTMDKVDDDAKDNCPEEDKILAMNVGEIEGFSISSNGEVQLLKTELP